MYPECLEKMVDVAKQHPEVGVVGAYSLAGSRVRCDGLSLVNTVLPGPEVCRLTLLGKIYPFWSPSSLLIRSDLVRERKPFYSPGELHADVEVMYEFLQNSYFGFVHQVLTFIREHEQSETTKSAKPLNTLIWSNFSLFVQFGPVYLTQDEFNFKLRYNLRKYYVFLADCAIEGRNKEFWQYHRNGLKSVGYPLNVFRLLASLIAAMVCKPRQSARRFARRLKAKN
jgi:hypothetical protein